MPLRFKKDTTMTSRLITLAGAFLALSLASGASAHDYKLGDLEIAHPWTRATLPNAPVGGAYLSIENNGTKAVTLTGATTPVAKTAEVHSMAMTDGVMTMKKVEGGLTIEPGATVTLKPGGYHVMLMGLTQSIEEGASIPMTLEFSTGETIDVDLKAEAVGATMPGEKPAEGAEASTGKEHEMGHGQDH